MAGRGSGCSSFRPKTDNVTPHRPFPNRFAPRRLDQRCEVCPRSRGTAPPRDRFARTPDANYDAWAERLNAFEIPNGGKVDRFWFRSLYVREPNGVLFEIATDGPGFAVDEDPAKLGETVVLPPFLEPHRTQIVANLKPID